MKYNELTIEAHSTVKRKGRGIGSGKGKTAGRGTKGQRSRTGSSRKPGFEGGQTPLMQQLPKLPGFTNHRPKPTTVFIHELDQFVGKVVDTTVLAESGLIPHPYVSVKVLVGKGELTKKVTVKLQRASKTAIAQIEKAGGSFESTQRSQRQKHANAKSK